MKTITIYNVFVVDNEGRSQGTSGQLPCSFKLTQELLDGLETRLSYKVGASFEVEIRDYDPALTSVTSVYNDNEIENGLLGYDFNDNANTYIYDNIFQISSDLV